VTTAFVEINQVICGEIGKGIVILLGIEKGDSDKDVHFLAEKAANLRIFEDSGGKMNRSIVDIDGEALIVSQFTLAGDCRKGRRPSFENAAEPNLAEELYKNFISLLQTKGIKTAEGKFGTTMKVSVLNDGPVTFILDSRRG
jgi:D-tyrosyl-tRNA(Tyr) deacylase